jgi:drug/metabolite transporter (DMT)-like permease
MTLRRVIAIAGAAVSVLGIALADRFESASLALAFAGGVLLGTAAAFTAVRSRRDVFGAPAVAFILWFASVLGVLTLWLAVTFEPPPD